MTEGFVRCSLKNFTTPELKECVKQLETGSKGKNKKKEKDKNKHSSHHTGRLLGGRLLGSADLLEDFYEEELSSSWRGTWGMDG